MPIIDVKVHTYERNHPAPLGPATARTPICERRGDGAAMDAVGVRIMLRDELPADPADQRMNRAFAAAGKHGLPVNFLCWGRLNHGTELVRRNPNTVFIIDHLGLLQPNAPPLLAEPWADLPKLLALVAYPNARVKISGACTFSRERYPYDDI
jgi:L-fuconolactonase